MQLNYYRVKDFTKRIGAGVCDSWYVELGAVAKHNSTTAAYCLPNEVVCSDIGRFLRLPLPPSGIIHTPLNPDPNANFWFTCLDFTLSGNAPPPVDPVRCVQELPDLSTGLIVFDILIGNSDRHTQNLAVDFSNGDAQMNVFDHSHALLGPTAGQGVPTLQQKNAAPLIYNHCLIGHLDTHTFFTKWIQRVRDIPDFLIQEISEMTVTFGATQQEAQEVQNFLTHRRNNINNLINANQPNFIAINPWRPV